MGNSASLPPVQPGTAPPPGGPALERTFVPAADAITGAALPLGGGSAPITPAAPRDVWLRLAIFCGLLGTVLTIISAWMTSRQDNAAVVDASGMASYHQVVIPLLALGALSGVLMLERRPAMGMALALAGTLLALPSGVFWLLPAALMASVWAARHNLTARVVLGFLLLLPGVAGVYYGAIGALGYFSGMPVFGMDSGLTAPVTLPQALAPLEFLPLAVMGAWLLVSRADSGRQPAGTGRG